MAGPVYKLIGLSAITMLAGCARSVSTGMPMSHSQLRQRAMECLKAAVGYEHNVAVRVEAVEALESSGFDQALPWIRMALLDEHPAVRFAGCVAVGRLRDAAAELAVRERLNDDDASVISASLFALHRLGHTTHTSRMPVYLLKHEDATVRRNAAFVLGLLDERGAVKVLARAMRDRDAGVRHHALEAMARLGVSEAKQELTFMTKSGVGSEEFFAIQALAATCDPAHLDTFRYKLATATHVETRLAAAYGLGMLGSDEGLGVAMSALTIEKPTNDDPNDQPEMQVLRVRQLAAAALGAVGRVDALPALSTLLEDRRDPRLQVSAARAILEILEANQEEALPFAAANRGRSR